ARAILAAGAATAPRSTTVERLVGSSLRRSSVVERAAVNRLVVGSSPTAGANSFPESGRLTPSSQVASESDAPRKDPGAALRALDKPVDEAELPTPASPPIRPAVRCPMLRREARSAGC